MPYVSPSLSGFNASPPPDDGSQVESNSLQWARDTVAKIGNPLKTFAEEINTAVKNRFDFTPDYFKTAAEITVGVTIVDGTYLPGYALRYGENTTPGTTEVTTAVQNAINVMNVDGGDVFLTGIMAVGELTIKSNVTIRSAPNQRATLKRISTARILDTNGSTASKVSFIGVDFDGNSDFTNVGIQITPGSTNVLFEDCEFTKFDDASSSFQIAIQSGSSSSVTTVGITIRNCRFLGVTPGTPVENANIIKLNNVEDVLIEGNTFDTCGGIVSTTGSNFTGTLRNIKVIKNTFRHIDGSNILWRPAPLGVHENLAFNNNEFFDVDVSGNNKPCINVGESASASGGTMRNIKIHGNGCITVNEHASGIKVGSSNGPVDGIENVSVKGNTIYCRQADGTISTSGTNWGIWIQNDVIGFSVTGNQIEGTSSRGIALVDCRQGLIENNTLRSCQRETTNTAFGGIVLSSGPDLSDINITGNTLIDCGNATGQAPIRMKNASDAAITRIFIDGNTIRDSREPAVCNYAINNGDSTADVRMGTNFITKAEFINDTSLNVAPNYTVTNGSTDRSFDANAADGSITSPPTQAEVENIRDAVLELADVVGTMISDLQNISTFK